jgi:hypothetical protein
MAPVETLVSSGPGGFDIAGKVFLAEGLEGLSTFGDSLLGIRLSASEAEWIS